MRKLLIAVLLAGALSPLQAGAALADCPSGEPDCSDAVPTVDSDGQPIPYVEEITAPPDGTALTYDQP